MCVGTFVCVCVCVDVSVYICECVCVHVYMCVSVRERTNVNVSVGVGVWVGEGAGLGPKRAGTPTALGACRVHRAAGAVANSGRHVTELPDVLVIEHMCG